VIEPIKPWETSPLELLVIC